MTGSAKEDALHSLAVRVDWDRQAVPLPTIPGVRLHTLHVDPEPSHPFGRKGLVLASAWDQLARPDDAGMLICDGDVVADPSDFAAMFACIFGAPDLVWVAPVKLWPRSTGRLGYVWGHGHGGPSKDFVKDPTSFTFSFTYLPRRLVTRCVRNGLRKQVFPNVDRFVSDEAKAAGIPVMVCMGASPKHLHW